MSNSLPILSNVAPWTFVGMCRCPINNAGHAECTKDACPLHSNKRKFQIEFSGMATDVEADSPEQAWEKIQKYLNCYAHSHTIKEIGVDVDEYGNVLKPVAPLHEADRIFKAGIRRSSVTLQSLNDTDPWEI